MMKTMRIFFSGLRDKFDLPEEPSIEHGVIDIVIKNSVMTIHKDGQTYRVDIEDPNILVEISVE